MKEKTVASSKSTISNVMQPSQANPAGNVHGGEIMKLMDTAASVTAMRHCLKNVVTLRVDELIFHQPIYVGNLVTINSKMVYVGNTSMEIKVEVWVEELTENVPVRLAQSAFFTFVALDENGKTTFVPKLIAETEEEKQNLQEGRHRHELRKKNRLK